VVDKSKLVCWDLEAGGTEDSAHSTRRVAVETLAIDPNAEQLTLSHDCSQIAYIRDTTVFLHDLRVPGPLGKYTSQYTIIDLQFSPDQCRLWVIIQWINPSKCSPTHLNYLFDYYLVKLAMVEGGGFGNVIPEVPVTGQSWTDLPSHGCSIGVPGSWVKDPRGIKLLWLPPNWRQQGQGDARWNGDFLALTHDHHPEPIIIQFYL